MQTKTFEVVDSFILFTPPDDESIRAAFCQRCATVYGYAGSTQSDIEAADYLRRRDVAAHECKGRSAA